ncbi:MBL fold metallo-hydrolase [Flagellimonas myxillae]|uniref:MBL fold metallo-hydrolase n=1 Tax=Flagellimonas myxillae TaxID=2942214 RepID=UPI00201F8D18|nr:MBL fold metallo-hydrolase [Muricauda myxillae]MCL6266424.1 MBL fold metallo-hydrolase [Muricauda myxillae]
MILLIQCILTYYAIGQDISHKRDQQQAVTLFKSLKEVENSEWYKGVQKVSFTLIGLNNNPRQAYDMTKKVKIEDSKETFIGHWFYDFENKKYRNYTRALYHGGHDLRFEELNHKGTSYYITTQMRKYNSASNPFENTKDDCMNIPGLWLSKLDDENLGLSYIGKPEQSQEIIELTFNGLRRRLYINDSNMLQKVSWVTNDLISGKRQNTISYGKRINLHGFKVPNSIEQYVDDVKRQIRTIKRIQSDKLLEDTFRLDKDLSLFDKDSWVLKAVSKNVFQYQGLGGQLYNISFVVFPNFILVYDAMLSPGITNKFLHLIKKDFPNKPVKYVVLSHNHTDHVSGLRGYNLEGVTVLTSKKTQGRVSQYIAEENRRCLVEIIDPGRFKEISDGKVKLKVVNVGRTPHVDDMLYVIVNSDEVVIEADSFFEFSPWGDIFSFFLDWIRSNKLDYFTIIGTHVKPTSFKTIQKAMETSSKGVYPEYLRMQGLMDE